MTGRKGMYYDREGKPMEHEEFARRFEDMDYRRIGLDQVGAAEVSTVWLGINHNYHGGSPEIFETMVHTSNDSWLDIQERYATEAQALAGHAAWVRRIQDANPRPSGSHEELIMPGDDRPIADVEPGSLDISGLDKAELLAALVNAADVRRPFGGPFTHEQAAAIVQDRLSAGSGPPFNFDDVAGRPVNCDIGGSRISAFHVARYDRDAGAGAMARVVGELALAYERRQREKREKQQEREL